MLLSCVVPAMAWDGYKEVAVTVNTAEDVAAMVALENEGFDYIETRSNEDDTASIIYHIRTQEEEDALSQYNFSVLNDFTNPEVADAPFSISSAAAAAGEPKDGLMFEVDANGWIVGMPIGDNSARYMSRSASVYPDAEFDYSNVSFDPVYGFPNRLGYRTVTEYYSEMTYLAKTYPHLVKIHNMGYSWYGRPMWVMEICNNPGVEDGRAEWLHLAATHAREWPANELSLNNAWWFVTQYDKYLKGDTTVEPRIVNIMENVRSWMTPHHNPDGVHWDQTNGNSQRKNRRPANVAPFGQEFYGTTAVLLEEGSLGAANYIGTDLNRNWAYRWGSSDGSSIWNQTSESTNRGMGPGSEPENVALTGFMRNRMIGSDISGHTSGDLVIFPWSNKKGAAEPVSAVMDFVKIARELASYNIYTDYHERVIYSQAGEGQEYMYGGYRALGFTVEMGWSFKPTYLGANFSYATAAFKDRNPNVGFRTLPLNYAATGNKPTTALTAPMAFLLPPADPAGEYPAQTTFVPTYTHQNWRTRVSYLQAELDKDPNFVKGKILVCYNVDGSTGNTVTDVALLAQNNGAVGLLLCTIPSGIAPNSSHGLTTPSAITAGSGVTIPVAGTGRMYARELLEYTRDGKDWDGNPVENKLTLEVPMTQWNAFKWTFQRNAYMYVTLAEKALEYAGHIQGKVTAADGTVIPGANLNLTKDVYLTTLAEQVRDQVFWDPKTHTGGNEGPASTASAANTKPDWSNVDWSLYAPWGKNVAHRDEALVNYYDDIAAWFKANPPMSRFYDKLVPYKHPETGDVFQTTVEKQTGYIDILNADGTYNWSVVPSQQFETYAYEGRNQPNWTGGNATNQGRGLQNSFEVNTPDDPRIGKFIYKDEGYAIVAKAPGYYDSDAATVFVEDYQVVKKDVDFKVIKAVESSFVFTPDMDPTKDIVVNFKAFNKDGSPYTGKAFATLNNYYVVVDGTSTAFSPSATMTLASAGEGEYTLTLNLESMGIYSVDNAVLALGLDCEFGMSPLVIGQGTVAQRPDNLVLTPNKPSVVAGEYFTLASAFASEVETNAFVITYKYDPAVFEYAGFTPDAGISVLNTVIGDGEVTLTLGQMTGYGVSDFGGIMLRAKEALTFNGSIKTISANADYVLNTVPKTIVNTDGFASIRTNPDFVLGDFTLIDLSNIIDWFGTTDSDPNWYLTIAVWDFNNSGSIDISDVSYVAKLVK